MMLSALAIVVASGVATFIGYKWGSHEATENAIEVLECYTEPSDLTM